MRRVPWVALGAAVWCLVVVLGRQFRFLADLAPSCAFKRLTGVPCATCGLTRCVLALGRGDWAGAFHWHPAAAFATLVLPALALWDLRRAFRGEAYPRLPDSPWARAAAWVLLLAVWGLQVARGV